MAISTLFGRHIIKDCFPGPFLAVMPRILMVIITELQHDKLTT